MSQLICLGAINKVTGEYIQPKFANKKDEYICPDCNAILILCQGEMRIFHFRHKVDNFNICNRYNHPSESQIHKDAKTLLKNLFEKKETISFVRNCCCCKINDEFEIPEMSENSKIELEYKFEYNGTKIADVAYLDEGNLFCVFEIYNTHKTKCENRPEPWFEIDAKKLIQIANNNSFHKLEIPCIRCEKCEDCIEKENANLKYTNIDKYIRQKLGQKYPIPEYAEHLGVKDKIKHLRFNFHAGTDVTQNKQILELFAEDFMNKKIVIHTWKGNVDAFVVSPLSYSKYNYWNYFKEHHYNPTEQLPFENEIEMTSLSTTEILKKLILYCRNANAEKEQKIKEIKNNIDAVSNEYKENVKNLDIDDDADTLRSMRYSKQSYKNKFALSQELIFVENDVKYKLYNNVIEIQHPLTETKLKRSLVNNKTYYKGKWRNDVSIKLIIAWYSSKNDILDEL